MTVKVFYNPDCSKCRGAVDLLDQQGIEPEIVRYLDEPPSAEQIREVLELLGVGPRAILRTGEKAYAELGLDDPSLTDEQIVDAMAAHPILIQRPIVIANGKAVIGRPPERVFSIL